jgi:hypothetical protein
LNRALISIYYDGRRVKAAGFIDPKGLRDL